jgi:hypothetical protein
MADKLGMAFRVLKQLDGSLRKMNKKIRMAFFWMRFAQIFLILAVLASWTCAVGAIYYPDLAGYFYAGAIVLLSIGLIPWAIIVGLPLRLKMLRRMAKQGYAKSAREVGLRAMARKWHDKSIETEELLFDTAINEGRKAYRRYKKRAGNMRNEMDDLRPRP